MWVSLSLSTYLQAHEGTWCLSPIRVRSRHHCSLYHCRVLVQNRFHLHTAQVLAAVVNLRNPHCPHSFPRLQPRPVHRRQPVPLLLPRAQHHCTMSINYSPPSPPSLQAIRGSLSNISLPPPDHHPFDTPSLCCLRPPPLPPPPPPTFSIYPYSACLQGRFFLDQFLTIKFFPLTLDAMQRLLREACISDEGLFS
ncbi:hypothetical protein VNO80_13311 [Phaseolus coccineus]|uniref:Uncharacterized protein n=1 Tax=Phaseolus coccineus TaxID=3886 RepID=A0AAN9N0R1_PHACN